MKPGHIRLAAIIAIIGGALLIAGIFLSGLSYNQLPTSSYSCANHFIAELGWSKSSTAEVLVNWGLVVSHPGMVCARFGPAMGIYGNFSAVA